MGSGKTTHGRKLARLLGYKFIDLDKQIEQSENSTISDMFRYQGETYFREAESRQLKKTESNAPTVISLGGGTPCYYDNLDWILANGFLIYIAMSDKAICQRLMKSRQKRPLVQGKTEAELLEYVQQLLAVREPCYQKAQLTVNGLSLKTEELAKQLKSQLA